MVLPEQALISGRPAIVCAWVPPTIKQITAFAAVAAGAAGCFHRRRAVIDHPDLIEVVAAHHDLVELHIVLDAVQVDPIRSERPTLVEVDVDALRSLRDYII